MEINIDSVFLITIIIVFAIMIAFVLLAYSVFVKRIMQEKKLQHQKEIQHQKDLLRQNIESQENERERIAELLHDEVGNKLNILSVWLNNPDTWNSERLKEVVSVQLPNLIESTRTISHRLYPVNFEEFGFVISIENLIHSVETSLNIKLIIQHHYIPKDISFEVQLYRVIQEFLSNVLKHSEASQFDIHIRDEKNALSIILSDNGKGIDFNNLHRGMGLRNIELRVKSLNAIFKWKSKVNKGVQLIIIVPKS
jgi:signal transduction histidine kinase